jgi:hypothetical protein
MEYSLHRQLKERYARPGDAVEVRLDRWRIDVVRGDELVEIQHAPLASIRDKIRALVEHHRVLVVKPVVVAKLLVKRSRKGGRVVERRKSPGPRGILDVFDELVHFTRVFPHERLTIDVVPVEIEELRYPRRGRRRFRQRAHHVEDQRLVAVGTSVRIATAADLRTLAGCDLGGQSELAGPFDTGELASALGIERWQAQRIAYCFRQCGTVEVVSKRRNALVYAWSHAADQDRAA